MKVTYSKIRGTVWPALALPDAPNLDRTPRELTVLLSTAEHDAATVEWMVDCLSKRGGTEWDLCICERTPVDPAMARTLAGCRGKHAWIRIVTTSQSVDDATAARWTMEQATGEFVAFLARGCLPDTDAIAALLVGVRNAPVMEATKGLSLGIMRKSDYLAAPPPNWAITAPTQSLSQARGATAWPKI